MPASRIRRTPGSTVVNDPPALRRDPSHASRGGTLASRGETWQGRAMTDPMLSPKPPSAAGGALIALAVMVGSIAGLILGQPTIGFLIGLALGVIAALLIWWTDRK